MRRLLILPTVAAVLLTTAAPAAMAADGDVIHRESILTELDPSGAPGTSRVFTQVTVPSGEQVSLSGQSTDSLRTLSGSSSRDGDDVVFGGGLSRTVADNTADLPVEIEVSYSIDGETVDARDVVGHDGEVAVTYIVRNLTSEPTEVTVSDGDRVASKETVDVAVPFVGSLSMTLPPAFSGITAPGAVVVGDGRGNTVVNWSLLLFSPLGSETQEVTWTANARDAVVPEAVLQVVPVSPDSFGSFESTSTAYEGAVSSTRELTSGTRQIDRNLKLLAEGAGKLLAGLTQLRDGSAELATGLGDARDGSGELSAGLGTARAGGGELASGLGELSLGASAIADGLARLDAGGATLIGGLGQLADGSKALADGVGELADGAGQVDDGAKELAAGAGGLATGAAGLEAGINELSEGLQGPAGLPAALDGINQLQAGIGALDEPGATILFGLGLVGTGLADAQAGIDGLLVPGVDGVIAGVDGVELYNNGVAGQATGTAGNLNTAFTQLSSIDPGDLTGAAPDQVAAALAAVGEAQVRVTAIQGAAGQIAGIVDALQAGLDDIAAGLLLLSQPDTNLTPGAFQKLRAGVAGITGGMTNPTCDPKCGVVEGLQALEDGLTAAATKVAAGLGTADTENTLLWGASQVAGGSALVAGGASQLQSEGTAAVAAGAEKAADGAEKLAAGAAKADAGAGELGDGAGQLADGSVKLADGAQKAATGSNDLAVGLGKLDDGAARLASGLVSAADGSQQLADGLARATPGGEQIANGAQRLTDEGTSVLARSVSDASASSSLQLAHVTAVAARGTNGDGLPYPTTDGAVASAVYEFELAGVGADSGPGAASRIGLGALALLAAALLGSMAGGRLGRRDELVDA